MLVVQRVAPLMSVYLAFFLFNAVATHNPALRIIFGLVFFLSIIWLAHYMFLFTYEKDGKLVFQRLFSRKAGNEIKVLICSIPLEGAGQYSIATPWLYLAEIIAVRTGKDKPNMFSAYRCNFNPETKRIMQSRFAMDEEYTDYFFELDQMIREYEVVSTRKLAGIGDVEESGREIFPKLKRMALGRNIKMERVKYTFRDFFFTYKKKKRFSDRKIKD